MSAMKTQKLYVIAIGGIMTSGIARLYHSKGWEVAGSDAAQSSVTDELAAEGITVHIGQKAENIADDIDLVVYSVAVTPGSDGYAELEAAKGFGITCKSLDEVVSDLTREYFTISLAGVHGKSTTTAMTAKILIDANMDPTVLVGTKMPELNGRNVLVGESKYLVLEADDYARKFTSYKSDIAVINNIEAEHLDFYGDEAAVVQAFADFVSGLADDGVLIANGQDEKTMQLVRSLQLKPTQKLHIFNEQELAKHDLQVFGDFNMSNAEAAAAVARELGLTTEQIEKSLHSFAGTWRRQEKLADNIYTDYAHHPTEIAAAISGFKNAFADKRLIVVFQPHQADRTKRLFEDFLHAFDMADETILLPIYIVKGRDEGIEVSSEQLVDAMNSPKVHYEADFANAFARAKSAVDAGEAVALFMGAGTIDGMLRGALKQV